MNRWVVGWGVGTGIVLIAASLLVTIIALCRRIVRQAGDITRSLDASREQTAALFAVTDTNAAVSSIVEDLRTVREGLEAR
jgi:hypothetical protein